MQQVSQNINPDKQVIARRFGKSIRTYEQEGCIQRRIAMKMIRLLKETVQDSCIRIMEFGCGTGFYSRLLYEGLHPEFMVLNDLCFEMEVCLQELLGEKIKFLPGDAERIHFPGKFDLITSCSTLQWFHDPEAFINACSRSLNTQKYLAFTTFGTRNLCEMKELTGYGLSYLSIENLKKVVSEKYEILYMEEEISPIYFDSPMAVLQHLRRTGVTGLGGKSWTRKELTLFERAYIRKFAQGNTIPLTYHPIYIIAQKKK